MARRVHAAHFGEMAESTSNRPADGTERTTVRYAASLGTFSGTMLVVGGIIGAGIFLSPAEVASRVGGASLTLGAWALGALVAIIGGFIYAELGARRPQAGGTYIYLRDAWGPLPAFMYGWALFLIVATGALAAVAMTGANYIAALLGFDPTVARPIAAALIVVLTLLNIAGVRIGAATGNVLTILKLTAIGTLVVAALTLTPSHALPALAAAAPPVRPTGFLAITYAMSTALVPVLFSYGGWQQTNAVAEELVDPERTLPKALVFGVVIVVATYMLVNLAYLRALGVAGLAASKAPAADSMYVYLGTTGRVLITAGIVASTVGFLTMVILMSARVYQAMAADGLFFGKLAELHPRTRTPVGALVAQAVVTLVLLLSNTYGALLDYVVFADWIFFGSTAASLFVLRRIDARSGRQASVLTPLHPYSTLVFITAAAYVVLGSVTSNPGNALRGAGLFALGVPVYAYWKSRRAA